MTGKQRRALLRLTIIAAAWAVGEAIVRSTGMGAGLGLIVPALLAVAAYVATGDLGWSPGRRGRGGGNVVYWRGRPVDRDDWRH